MVCDYYETTILNYTYSFRGKLIDRSMIYSRQKGYIYPLSDESYDDCLSKELNYKLEIDTSKNEDHIITVVNNIYSKHNFLYPNENFISPFNSITDDEIANYIKINNLLNQNHNQNQTVDDIKNNFQRINNSLLEKLNKTTDVKVIKIMCEISRFEHN
jgi:hypothetical protein